MVKLVEAGLTGDVEEDDRCAVDEVAGGDGPRLCLFHRRRGAAGGHAGRLCGSGRLQRLRIRRRGLLYKCHRGRNPGEEQPRKKRASQFE